MPPRTPAFRSRGHGLSSILSLLLLLTIATPAEARPEPPRQRLETAIDIYQHGGYLEAAAILTNLLYPLKLTDRPEIVRAKVYLGLCYYVLDRKEEAEEEFRGVFKIDPKYQPDPLFIPGEIIVFIERLRPVGPPTPRSTPVLGLGEQLVDPGLRPLKFSPLNLLPLGIPQFRHGDTGRGAALLSTQVSLLAINMGSYWYLTARNPEQGDAGELYSSLIAAKAINITSLTLLGVTVLFGMGDALYRYRLPSSGVGLHLNVSPGELQAGLLWRTRF